MNPNVKWPVVVLLLVGLTAVALSATSCGGKYEVSGQVDHVVKIDLSSIEQYFQYECDDKQPGDKCYNGYKQACVDCLVGDFLEKVGL